MITREMAILMMNVMRQMLIDSGGANGDNDAINAIDMAIADMKAIQNMEKMMKGKV